MRQLMCGLFSSLFCLSATIAISVFDAVAQTTESPDNVSVPDALNSGESSPIAIPVIPPLTNSVSPDANNSSEIERLPEGIAGEARNPVEQDILTPNRTFSETPNLAQSDDDDNVITLGQPANAPFVVAIPGSREDRFNRLQTLVPNAFLTDSRRGRYIQAGAFSSRSDAEALSAFLRHQGFDARVVYFRVR